MPSMENHTPRCPFRSLCALPVTAMVMIGYLALGTAQARLSEYPFRLVTEELADGQRLVLVNNGPAPVSVVVTVTGENMGLDRPASQRLVVAPRTKLAILRAFAFDPRRPFKVEPKISYRVGDERITPDEAPLRLPFPEGKSAKVLANPDRPAAKRFELAAGTEILAARAGRVIDLDDDAVILLHSDGTYARYGDMTANPGLRKGQEIPLAGSLGKAGESSVELALQRTTAGSDAPNAQPVPYTMQAYRPLQPLNLRPGETVTADYSHPYEPPPPPPPPPPKVELPAPASLSVIDIDRDTLRRAFASEHGRAPGRQVADRPLGITLVWNHFMGWGSELADRIGGRVEAVVNPVGEFMRNPPQLGPVVLAALLFPLLLVGLALLVLVRQHERSV